MEKNVEKALDSFIETPVSENEKEVKKENKNVKKVILDEREGLIERLDKQYVTSDGRQLLREVY